MGCAPARAVNLEPALRAGDALGGHFVLGHVDGRADGVRRATAMRARSACACRAPASLQRYMARKGSVALDGVSLTVNEVDGAEFDGQPGAAYTGGDDARRAAARRGSST